MKLLHSSALRAICTLVVSIIMLLYPGETERWISIVVGVLFIIPGVSSVIAFYVHRNDHAPENHRPMFPLAGWGSILLGAAILILHSQAEQTAFILLGALLIILSISTLLNLIMSKKYYHVGVGNFIIPVATLVVGLMAILFNDPASGNILTHTRFFQLIGLAFVLYGLTELYYSIRISSGKHSYNKRLREEEKAKIDEERIKADYEKIKAEEAPSNSTVEPEITESETPKFETPSFGNESSSVLSEDKYEYQ